MFSKEESAKLRKEFWTSFGKSFPRKWILYNTQIKDFSFKFVANQKGAMVCLDIESYDATKNQLLFEQLTAIKNLIIEDYVPSIVFDDAFQLENGKVIHRIYVKHTKEFNIHNKNTWQAAYEFFNLNMHQFEMFYDEFEDFIKQAVY
jgi:nitrite reductase/ring-hydroxylating ferredoxin subunit